MPFLYQTIFVALFANAVISFCIAFFWQAKVIVVLLSTDDPSGTMGLFLSGGFHRELRRKWGKAIAYVSVSYAALFLVAFLVQSIAPEIFK